MEQPLGARVPFNQAAIQQSDIKERFYRYFQEEVTGMTSSLRRVLILISSRASGADGSIREPFLSWRRKAGCYRSLSRWHF